MGIVFVWAQDGCLQHSHKKCQDKTNLTECFHILSPQLDEDLFYFLLSRNENNEELAIEDGYNLRDACLHNGHKTHVTLFKQVIEGELEENVFHYWLHLQTTLTEEFSKQQVGHVSEWHCDNI